MIQVFLRGAYEYMQLSQRFILIFYHIMFYKSSQIIYFLQKLSTINEAVFCTDYTIGVYFCQKLVILLLPTDLSFPDQFYDLI